jgi:hypothetical protein
LKITKYKEDPYLILLRLVGDAEESLSQSLTGPCTAADYAAMSLAEPLLGAARRLLEWGSLRYEAASRPGEIGSHTRTQGVASTRELVARALATAQEPDPRADPRLAQVRSLLVDAAKALSR